MLFEVHSQITETQQASHFPTPLLHRRASGVEIVFRHVFERQTEFKQARAILAQTQAFFAENGL